MVLDSSAILAILLDEPERALFTRLIGEDPTRLVSVVTRVEAGLVIETRKGDAGRARLDTLLNLIEAEISPVTAEHGQLAMEAFRRFGKGRHRAGLNLGDCFVYALARSSGEPLLFRGDDFVHTDIARCA